MGIASFNLLLVLIHVFAFLSLLKTAGPDVDVFITGDVTIITTRSEEEHADGAPSPSTTAAAAAPLAIFGFVVFPPGSTLPRPIRGGFPVVVRELDQTATTTKGDHGVVILGSSGSSSVPWWEWDNPAALCRLYAEAYCGSFCSKKKKKKRHVLLLDDDDDDNDDDEQQLQRCRLRCVAVADFPCRTTTMGRGVDTTYYSGTAQYFSTNEELDLPRGSIASVGSIDLSTVERSTGGFSKRNIIGEGGFAIVYKGKLPRNHVLARDLHYQRKIAVKKLKPLALSTKGLNDFTREVKLMSKLRHGNLSRLLAYCIESDERILVYEYMPKKSLDFYIFGTPKHRASLNWSKRLEIIRGMAQGVNYLHDGSGEIVIHRDLKPSNVLLDDELTPKISDFGTTKPLVAADETGTQTIVFSPGYAAPEYIRGDVTLKCDVYSFGVVLLEIISGQKNSLRPSLLSKAWKLWDEHRIMDLMDSSMARRCSEPELQSRVRRCIQIGLLCVQESPGDRPNMSQVLMMLTSDSSWVNKPKPPAVCDDNYH
uniref:non-specific serine/threonine protein kinase n=1 Tax=Leersia perrieri TaxID=77586 RepID=A0A0D9VVF7_9ORYZ